jgi:uncharacterized protein HemX
LKIKIFIVLTFAFLIFIIYQQSENTNRLESQLKENQTKQEALFNKQTSQIKKLNKQIEDQKLELDHIQGLTGNLLGQIANSQ